jgi:bleomycin hydrolase
MWSGGPQGQTATRAERQRAAQRSDGAQRRGAQKSKQMRQHFLSLPQIIHNAQNRIMKRVLFGLGILGFSLGLQAQIQPVPRQDKAVMVPTKPGYYQNTIMKDISTHKAQEAPAEAPKRLRMDMSGLDLPKSSKEFKSVWHNAPISQGNTGTCWCYSTASFFETEIKRQTGKVVKLSELYTVYWEYVEKARRFVRERGNSHFDEGSQANAVIRMFSMYGALPESAYNGRPNGEPFNDHSQMADEMKAYLKSVKEQNNWNEEQVLSTIKSILDHHIGTPPNEFVHDGKKMTPMQYMKDVLKFNPDDYVDMTSMMAFPYYSQCEYDVPDNWWNAKNYYNVPLDTFMAVIDRSVKNGYSMFIGGDVSEPGYNAVDNVVMIPSFDIPSAFIDENARQFRFSNGSTTDDHGMHLVGRTERSNGIWYLVKDSGSGSRNCGPQSENFGYYFIHSDYLKLKFMTVLVHKDMFKNLLPRFK